jgi:hypothetical protein
MGIFKDFPIFERFTAQVPAEAFNVFNYRQFTGANNSHGAFCRMGIMLPMPVAMFASMEIPAHASFSSGFLHPNAVHGPRILQFAAKILF